MRRPAPAVAQVVAAVAILTIASVAPAGAAVSVQIEPAFESVGVGERVRIAIHVRDMPSPGLAAFQLRLMFNPAIVRVEDPNAGMPATPAFAPLGNHPGIQPPRNEDPAWFLTSTGRQAVVALARVDNTRGELELAYGSRPGASPPTGSGVLAIFDVVGHGGGQSALDLVQAAVILVDNAEPPGQYAFTAVDGEVTVTGAPADTDGDGVPDDRDQCPGTPAGATDVDANGCAPSQRDTDGDGVTDDRDQCPGTPTGATGVDANGCAPSQRDTDGDGVTDDHDLCPATPAGRPVDGAGCADNQRDTDGDGVTDDLDRCSGTPAGQAVDPSGCAASQRDTDGDGVTDDRDRCPGTPAGATDVDLEGCSICSQLNRLPSAAIAAPGNAKIGSPITLDGSASDDPDSMEARPLGTRLTFAWTLVSAPPDSLAALSSTTAVRPTLTPDLVGPYVIRLVVHDGCVASEAAEVTINAADPAAGNVPPNADAGPSQLVPSGVAVALDGGASTDPDGAPEPLVFTWTFQAVPPGSAVGDGSLLPTPQAVAPTFTPDVAGRYILQLTVSDGAAADTATVMIDVVQTNVPPSVDAGADVTVNLGQTATVTGTATDPDGGPQPLTLDWTFLSVPAGSALTNASLTGADSSMASFLPDVAGEYLLQLLASDGDLAAADNVVVTVVAPLRGDVNRDGQVDMNDLNLMRAARNTPASGPDDPRDLNGDGMINILDERILVTLCSKPKCAT